MFFDNAWNSLVEMDSYGHDVEAGWLLCEAARVLEDRQLMDRANRLALDVTDACLAEGLSDKGYMMYEKKGGRTTGHASWWGQIEHHTSLFQYSGRIIKSLECIESS